MFGGKTNEGLESANRWSTATSLDTEFDWDWLGGKNDGMEREKCLVWEDTELGRDVLGAKNFGMELSEKFFVSAGKELGDGEEVLGVKNDGMELGEKCSSGTELGWESFAGKSKNKEGEISLCFTEYGLERGILTSMTGVIRNFLLGKWIPSN